MWPRIYSRYCKSASQSYLHRLVTAGLCIERGHCAALQLYWYNGMCKRSLLVHTCCLLVIILCLFQFGVVEICSLPRALWVIFMPSPVDNIGKGIMFSGCLAVYLPRSFVCSSGQILFPWYFMNSLDSVDETYREYSLAPTEWWPG